MIYGTMNLRGVDGMGLLDGVRGRVDFLRCNREISRYIII